MKVQEEMECCQAEGKASSRFTRSVTDDKISDRPSWVGVAEVTSSLYLCGAAAVAPNMLRTLGITCIVNAAAELPPTPAPDHVTCVRAQLLDTPADDLAQHVDRLADVIDQEHLRGGRTLVHCVAGVSRSASICLGYLVKHQSMSLREAFLHLRSRRPTVKPNCGFFKQLIEYEHALTGDRSVKMVHSEVTNTIMPDVYVADYQNMLYYQTHYNRRFGRN